MLPQIAAGVAIGSAILGGISGLNANKKAREAARTQGHLTYKQRMMEIAQIQAEADQTLGYNVAQTAASGLMQTGSTQRFIRAQQASFAQDIAQRKGAAYLERKAIRAGAPGGAANFATLAKTGASIGGSLMNYHRATT